MMARERQDDLREQRTNAERQTPDAAVDVLAELERTERRLLRTVLRAPWQQSDAEVARWEELLEHAAQTRIRLQQARLDRLGLELEREQGSGKTDAATSH